MQQQKMPIVAIVGRSNVGKSSLFNAILERREAIVAREEGTTRDSVTAIANYNNKQFWIVDTAGMKDPIDEFESTIQEQIIQASDTADIILVVVEAHIPLSDGDREVAKLALKSKKQVILVVNKADKGNPDVRYDFFKLGIKDIIETSVTQGIGIEELLATIATKTDLVPARKASEHLKIALLGRPNVGKSSLFNALLNKQQAIVADRAGTTRDINRMTIHYHNQELEFMDTAGIRRPGRIEQGVEQFSVLRSIAAIEQADICFLLIDGNEPEVALDQRIAGMVKDAGRGLALIVTKWDQIKFSEPNDYDELIKSIGRHYEFVSWAPLVVTSAIDGHNVTSLFDLALQIKEGRQTKLQTSELNDWLARCVRDHPPAGLKNRNPKLNYIVQETDNDIPAFKVFGSQTKFVHWSYRRFLERRMREAYNFFGNPIQFWFIEKHEAHRHGERPVKKEA